jgi:RimJ/RimL family protein N-acetyltransferase
MTDNNLVYKNIQLRLISFSDLEAIHRLHKIPEVDKYNTLGIPQTKEETKSIIEVWIKDNENKEIQNYTFAIELISSKIFLGLFGLKLGSKKYRNAEVWFKIHPDFWGKGIATDSLNCILDFGFHTLNLHRIEGGCAVDNLASSKVMEKAGMIKEGRSRKILPLHFGWSDAFVYAIIDSDIREKH